jgi:ABC-type sugar transport system substrate-binding protein
MRVSSVIAAGLCFLAVAAPSASPAQSPKAKATKAVVVVVKQTNRWWYSTGEGFVAQSPVSVFW